MCKESGLSPAHSLMDPWILVKVQRGWFTSAFLLSAPIKMLGCSLEFCTKV